MRLLICTVCKCKPSCTQTILATVCSPDRLWFINPIGLKEITLHCQLLHLQNIPLLGYDIKGHLNSIFHLDVDMLNNTRISHV